MNEIEKLLIFDLKGPIGHFRKFYTSSSSLSYTFPPRTALTGLIAGILGRKKDTYYEEFSSENCGVALSIRSPVRKIMQTVNYIRTKKSPRTENGRGGDGFSSAESVIKHFISKPIIKYPTPVELVVSSGPFKEIVYRIYFWHRNPEVMDKLKYRIKEKKFKYPPYLGISEFLAEVEFITEIPNEQLGNRIEKRESKEAVKIVTVCNKAHIHEGGLEFEDVHAIGPLQYVEEKMPLEFGNGREIKQKTSFIHERNRGVIKARLKIPYIEVTYVDEEKVIKENIVFMEGH